MKKLKQWISLLLVVAMLTGTLSAYAGFFEAVQDDMGGENSSYIEQEEIFSISEQRKYDAREMYNNFIVMDPEMFLYTDLIRQAKYMTDEQYKYVKQLTLDIVAGCKSTDEEIYAVAKYIAQNVCYKESGGAYNSHPYKVLTEEITRCAGYASAFETMMQILGHPCVTADSPNHAWNMVYNGSRWMLVDTTWMSYSQEINGEKCKSDEIALNWYDFSVGMATGGDYDHTILALPYSVIDDGLYLFPRYTTFTEYEIPGSITKIGYGAFDLNQSLTKITIPDSVTSIGDYAFSDCQSLTQINIPDSVTSIGKYAFSGCWGLTEITIPGSVTTIEEGAFQGCSFTEVVIPSGVTSIGKYAFENCPEIKRLVIPRSVTGIGDYAFINSYKAEIYYEGSEEEWQAIAIGNGNFRPDIKIHYNWDGETEFNKGTCGEFGDNVKWTYSSGVLTITGSGSMYWYLRNNTIYPPWYDWKDDITKIVIGDGITYISNTFDYCNNLKEVYIGEGVEWIDEYTFYYCPALETVTLPKSVEIIYDLAFGDCKNLKTVYYNGTEAQWNEIEGTGDLASATIVFNEPEIITTPFTDVPADAYYAAAVKWALENGVTTGTSATTFSPDATCTRGQVVTFLWRAKGCPEPKSTNNPFTDVTEKDYFYKAVLWAVENGITTGMSTTTFGPNSTCTSGQVVTFLWRANGEPAAVGKSTLAAANDGQWYSEAVAWADTTGLLSGTGTAFGVTNQSPRKDIVTYLYRDAVK